MRGHGLNTVVLFAVFLAESSHGTRTYIKVPAHPSNFESAPQLSSGSVTSCLNEATDRNERANAFVFKRPLNGSKAGPCQMVDNEFLAVGGTPDLYEAGYATTSFARFDPNVGGKYVLLYRKERYRKNRATS